MAITSYRAFVDVLEALDIAGMVRRYTGGPPSGAPGGADCPAQYVRYPGSDESGMVFRGQGGWPTLRAELVILVEPVAQGTQARNFDLAVDMMDNLATALRSSTCMTKGKLRWSVRMATDLVAGTAYLAVIASVEGNG